MQSIARQLGTRYETTFTMVHKIRRALAERCGWQLEHAFALDAVFIPVPKAANGDPADRPPVLVAVAVDPDRQPPDAVRFDVEPPPASRQPVERPADAQPPPDPDGEPPQPDPLDALLAEARHRHVHPAATPVPVGARELVANARRRVVTWLTLQFGGVSRRYLNNYLAQWAYTRNRAHRTPEMFAHIVRRMMNEAWTPSSELALPAP